MFDNTDADFGHSTTFSEGADSEKKGKTRQQTLFPVCVRQILDCPSEEFSLFQSKGNILTIVGILKTVNITSTKATYEVEDHTGKINCILWLGSHQEGDGVLPDVKEGCYVRVVGSYRINEGNKALLILNMVNISDPNDITTHLLEVIYVRYACEKGTQETVVTKELDGDFTSLQTNILNILKAEGGFNGMHIDAITRKISNASSDQIKKAIDDLQSDGHMFTTIDDFHYQTTLR